MSKYMFVYSIPRLDKGGIQGVYEGTAFRVHIFTATL